MLLTVQPSVRLGQPECLHGFMAFLGIADTSFGITKAAVETTQRLCTYSSIIHFSIFALVSQVLRTLTCSQLFDGFCMNAVDILNTISELCCNDRPRLELDITLGQKVTLIRRSISATSASYSFCVFLISSSSAIILKTALSILQTF